MPPGFEWVTSLAGHPDAIVSVLIIWWLFRRLNDYDTRLQMLSDRIGSVAASLKVLTHAIDILSRNGGRGNVRKN